MQPISALPPLKPSQIRFALIVNVHLASSAGSIAMEYLVEEHPATSTISSTSLNINFFVQLQVFHPYPLAREK